MLGVDAGREGEGPFDTTIFHYLLSVSGGSRSSRLPRRPMRISMSPLPFLPPDAEVEGRFPRRDAPGRDVREDRPPLLLGAEGCALGGRRGVGVRGIAHRADHFVQPRADGRVGDAQLRLDILDDAAILDEDLDEGEVFGAEHIEAAAAAEGETPLDGDPRRRPFQPRDDERLARHGVLPGGGVDRFFACHR